MAVALNFEAAVAGGIPVIKTLREALGANRVKRVYGILNGTCNYILSQMQSEKRAFADVLKEAQALGYAESDPTFDIGGFDAAHKLAFADEPRLRHPPCVRADPRRRHSVDPPRPTSRPATASATASSCWASRWKPRPHRSPGVARARL